METVAVIIGTVAVVLIAWLKGKDAGEQVAEKEVLDNVAKSKVPDGGDIDDVRQRLRDNAPRK